MGFQAFAGVPKARELRSLVVVVGDGGLVVPVLLHYNARTRGALFCIMKNLTSQTLFCITVQVQGFSETVVPTLLGPF